MTTVALEWLTMLLQVVETCALVVQVCAYQEPTWEARAWITCIREGVIPCEWARLCAGSVLHGVS